MSQNLKTPNLNTMLKDSGKHGILTRSKAMNNQAALNSPFTHDKEKMAKQLGKTEKKNKTDEPTVTISKKGGKKNFFRLMIVFLKNSS